MSGVEPEPAPRPTLTASRINNRKRLNEPTPIGSPLPRIVCADRSRLCRPPLSPALFRLSFSCHFCFVVGRSIGCNPFPLTSASRRSRTDTPEDGEPSRAGYSSNTSKNRIGRSVTPSTAIQRYYIFSNLQNNITLFYIIFTFFSPTHSRTQHNRVIKNS